MTKIFTIGQILSHYTGKLMCPDKKKRKAA